MKQNGSIGLGLAIGAALDNIAGEIGIGIALAIAMGAMRRNPDESE